MKPVYAGGHAAYQKLLISQIREHYPNSILDFDTNTWEIIERFYALDLSSVDQIMQDRYSIYGPKPRLPSDMLRSYLLSMKFKVTSLTAWVSLLKQNRLYAILSGFTIGDTPGIGTFMISSNVYGCLRITSLPHLIHQRKSRNALQRKAKRLHPLKK